ncbi:MAG: hypothetical protein ABJB66_16985 [Gemmatimonadaceae bacterium]
MRNSFRMTMAGLFALTAFTVSSVASAQVTGYGQSFVTPATPNPVLAFIGVDATGFTGTSTVDFFAEIYQFNGTNTVGSAIFFQ